jgi:excisionase family DNA binding protein
MLTDTRVAMDDDYLNARDAARYLGVSPTTLYKLINAGTLTTFRRQVNKRDRLIRRADLDRLKSPQPVGDKR